MLLGTLGASLLGNQLTGNGVARAGERTNRSVTVMIFNTAASFN